MELKGADSRFLKQGLFDNDPQAQIHFRQEFAFITASSSHASSSCYTEQWKVGIGPCGHVAEIPFLGSVQGLDRCFCVFHTSPRVVSNRPRRTINDHRFQRQMGLSSPRSIRPGFQPDGYHPGLVRSSRRHRRASVIQFAGYSRHAPAKSVHGMGFPP